MNSFHRLLLVAVLCLILLTGILPPVLAENGSENQSYSEEVIIDDSLQNVSGEQRVIVELRQLPDDEDVSPETLQAHANNTQIPFEQFANETAYVEIENQFWISNQILVTVDVDRVPLEHLGDVQYVERIFEEHDDEEIYPQENGDSEQPDPAVEPTDDTVPGFETTVTVLGVILMATWVRRIQ